MSSTEPRDLGNTPGRTSSTYRRTNPKYFAGNPESILRTVSEKMLKEKKKNQNSVLHCVTKQSPCRMLLLFGLGIHSTSVEEHTGINDVDVSFGSILIVRLQISGQPYCSSLSSPTPHTGSA